MELVHVTNRTSGSSGRLKRGKRGLTPVVCVGDPWRQGKSHSLLGTRFLASTCAKKRDLQSFCVMRAWRGKFSSSRGHSCRRATLLRHFEHSNMD